MAALLTGVSAASTAALLLLFARRPPPPWVWCCWFCPPPPPPDWLSEPWRLRRSLDWRPDPDWLSCLLSEPLPEPPSGFDSDFASGFGSGFVRAFGSVFLDSACVSADLEGDFDELRVFDFAESGTDSSSDAGAFFLVVVLRVRFFVTVFDALSAESAIARCPRVGCPGAGSSAGVGNGGTKGGTSWGVARSALSRGQSLHWRCGN
ncbi:hypothetical protein ABWH91_02300 [Phycisphaerales bacterium ac7]